MPTLTGTVISRYEILELLGIGAMVEVYRARDRDLDRDVAIKFLPQPFANSPERLARFGQEARTASSLNSAPIPGYAPLVQKHQRGHASKPR